MFTQAFHSIESNEDVGVRIVSNRAIKVFARAIGAGAMVGTGIVALVAPGAYLVDRHGGFILVLTAVAFLMALVSKRRFGTDLFGGAALILTGSVLKGTCRRADAVARVGNVVIGNILGAMLIAYLASRLGVFTNTTLLEVIAAKKLQSSYVTMFTQAVLCNWSLTMAAWAFGRFPRSGRRDLLMGICFLFFVGSGYEHGLANATLLTLANLLPHNSHVTWNAAAISVLVVTLGNLTSGAIVSRYGFKSLGERRAVPRE